MVEAVVQSKSQAPIDLKFDLPGRPVEGQPLEVAIALMPQIAARSATVSVTGSDGLKLDPGEDQFEFAGVEAGAGLPPQHQGDPDGGRALPAHAVRESAARPDSRTRASSAVPILVGGASRGSCRASGHSAAPEGR